MYLGVLRTMATTYLGIMQTEVVLTLNCAFDGSFLIFWRAHFVLLLRLLCIVGESIIWVSGLGRELLTYVSIELSASNCYWLVALNVTNI